MPEQARAVAGACGALGTGERSCARVGVDLQGPGKKLGQRRGFRRRIESLGPGGGGADQCGNRKRQDQEQADPALPHRRRSFEPVLRLFNRHRPFPGGGFGFWLSKRHQGPAEAASPRISASSLLAFRIRSSWANLRR
jgi:hypothetical protein